MKNLGQMMKQVQDMQARMAELQEQLSSLEIDGSAGAGLIKVTMNGKGEVRRVKIDPTLIVPAEAEVLEDLVAAAVNDAKTKVDAEVQARVSKLTGGIALPPGFKLPF